MEKPEWEQKLPAGYRMAPEADKGVTIGADWKAWITEWEPIRPNVVGTPLEPWTGNGRSHVQMCIPVAEGPMDPYSECALAEVLSIPTASGDFPDSRIPMRPFTPNKYTRTLHTLDGRKVPVDVYCVLAAFPTGSAAIDHAVKKLLAPGARGVKSRLQDIKEAHASLGRAIELEEGQGE